MYFSRYFFGLAVLTLTFVYTKSAGISTDIKNSIIIGDNLYFTDTSTILRSRDQGISFCQSQGAELAKVTNNAIYNQLRLAISHAATYWIDGIDKENHERFSLNTTCTPGELDYSDMPEDNLILPARTCLSLVKGSNASNSRIQAIDCVIPNRVLCSYPLNGCYELTTPTTTMAGGD